MLPLVSLLFQLRTSAYSHRVVIPPGCVPGDLRLQRVDLLLRLLPKLDASRPAGGVARIVSDSRAGDDAGTLLLFRNAEGYVGATVAAALDDVRQ
jgi:hypothetical protein